MISTIFKRIALLLLLATILAGAWLYWRAPDLAAIKPQLETAIKAQLHLKTLHLGRLSWRWAGYTWVLAKNVSFADRAGRIRAAHTDLAVRISLLQLLAARLQALSISVRHGVIDLHIPARPTLAGWLPPAPRIRLEDVTLNARYTDHVLHLSHLFLDLDAKDHKLEARFPGANLDLRWNAAYVPLSARMRFHNLAWLPSPWRRLLSGQVVGEITLRKSKDAKRWRFQATMVAARGARLAAMDGRILFPFDIVSVEGTLYSKVRAWGIRRIEWQQLAWSHGTNNLKAGGVWERGRLKLHLVSGRIALPLLASWARPFGDAQWQSWVQGAHHGRVERIQGTVDVAQPSPLIPPAYDAWQSARFRIATQLHDADVPLTGGEPPLRHMDSAVRVSDRGCILDVRRVLLPHSAGEVHGRVTVADWRRIVFNIRGGGKLDLANLLRWRREMNLRPELKWQEAPAAANFHFAWPLHADSPARGEARLTPDPVWRLAWKDQRFRLHAGSLRWRARGGIRLEGMRFTHELMAGILNLELKRQGAGPFRIEGFAFEGEGDFQRWASRLHLPLDAPAGRVKVSLVLDRGWHLRLDLGHASWLHLLGTNKALGAPYVLSAVGNRTADGIRITQLATRGAAPLIQGRGRLQAGELSIALNRIRAPAFVGDIHVSAPFDHAPIVIEIRSDFMDRTALPNFIPHAAAPLAAKAAATGKTWILRGFFRRIQWDAVSMQAVQVRFASARQGVGDLEAKKLQAAGLSVTHVRAFFRLPGNGVVDIRKLRAQMLGQNLGLTAVLSPAVEGGLRWRGYARVSGDFSEIIHRLDASRLFKGGTLHALWFGEGRIRPGRPWWEGMRGRLRLRADHGRILEGGTMTKLLAALSLTDLPKYLTRKRRDISGPGILYKRLQLEAKVHGERVRIKRLAMRASALDMAGSGRLSLRNGNIDLYVTVRPLQHLDALLRMIPLLRDIFLGPARSLFRLVYHVHGPLYDAKVEGISPKEAGLPEPGLVERLIRLPGRWFDSGK